MNRRTVLRTLATGTVLGTAGCTALGSDTDVAERTRTIDPAESALSAPEFLTAAAESHEVYGPNGVWGRAGTEPDHDLAFQGAWSTTLDHADGVRSDHLLALYELPPGPAGTDASQVWLWSGVDPADSGSVRRVETGLSLSDDGPWLGVYSPGRDYDADAVEGYDVEGARLDAATLSATMPLDRGTVGVGQPTRVGDGGAFHPYWEGQSDAAVGLAGTTEIRRPTAGDVELDWTVSVETTA